MTLKRNAPSGAVQGLSSSNQSEFAPLIAQTISAGNTDDISGLETTFPVNAGQEANLRGQVNLNGEQALAGTYQATLYGRFTPTGGATEADLALRVITGENVGANVHPVTVGFGFEESLPIKTEAGEWAIGVKIEAVTAYLDFGGSTCDMLSELSYRN